jgi:hypothetical protein
MTTVEILSKLSDFLKEHNNKILEENTNLLIKLENNEELTDEETKRVYNTRGRAEIINELANLLVELSNK